MDPFLTPVERLLLVRDGYDSPDPACRRRAAMILALDRGMKVSHVARAARCDPSLVTYWRDRYLDLRDVASLRSRDRKPKPTMALQIARLRRVAALVGTHPEGGRLPIDADARAVLAAQADAPDLPLRRRAAALLALDRGATLHAVGLALGSHRGCIHHLRRRYLESLARSAAPQG